MRGVCGGDVVCVCRGAWCEPLGEAEEPTPLSIRSKSSCGDSAGAAQAMGFDPVMTGERFVRSPIGRSVTYATIWSGVKVAVR